ncbi:MAG: HEAT repeat domain-containing protein, partial [Proteobacteria bacterium]|nr:HEAT repeat domain-containing protein [Pseudomonadota bacterium]
MKKLSLSLLAALMLFNFASCKKDEAPKAEEEAPKAEAEAPKDFCSTVTVDSLKALAKLEDKNGKQVITTDSYAEILDSLKCCKIDEKSFTLNKKECLTYDAIDQLKKDKVLFPATQEVMPKLVKSDSPIVRGEGYKGIASIFGAKKDDINLGKEAIKNEKDPYALQELVAGLSNEGNKDPEVGKFLVDMSKHENVFVRRKAAIALGNTWSDKVDGAVDAVIALMSDADENVTKLACAGSGKLGDEKVIEPIVKILNDDSKAKIHGDCVRGLSVMWFDYPFHKNHNENAYKATMDYLKKTPRTKDVPAWSSIAAFSTIANSKGEFDNWKKEATWFKMDEFSAVLTDLVKDENFSWLGKGPIFKAIAGFGGKAELEKLQPIVDGLKNDNVKKNFA